MLQAIYKARDVTRYMQKFSAFYFILDRLVVWFFFTATRSIG